MTRISWTALRAGLAIMMIASALTATAIPVQAGTAITVTTFADEDGENTGQCSLREAVVAANSNKSFGGCPAGSGGADTIFLSAGTYALARVGTGEDASHIGDLDISSSVIVTGAGVELTTVHGNLSDRIFDIQFANGVSVSNMRITGGNAVEGGAVRVYQATLDLFNVKLDHNQATILGGAVAIAPNSTVALYNSEITDNFAPRASAFINDGILSLNNTLIFANQNGNANYNGVVEITSTAAGLTRIENTTIANNSTPLPTLTAGVWVGSSASVLIRNVTIVDNSGPGLEVTSGGNVSMSNTIVARQKNNTADCKILSGDYHSLGHNLASDNSCNLNAGGDKPNTGDSIGLADAPDYNGGKTRTYALTWPSPAVDAGSPVLDIANPAACQVVDQRYYFRPGNGDLSGQAICDIGAFELEGTRPTDYTFLPTIIR